MKIVCLILCCFLLCGCWTELATKSYPQAPDVVRQVELYRPQVEAALTAHGLEDQTDLALVVMACESKGNTNLRNGGLYQFTTSTWSASSQSHRSRNDAEANILAMAENVKRNNGWRAWDGGRLSNGKLWGSGPKGHRCWRYP